MGKTVQIPEGLFIALCRYHLTEPPDLPELSAEIQDGLSIKLEAMIRRGLYSQYKDTSLSPEAREKARQAYLDAIGMGAGFRWDSLEPPP